VEDCSLNSCRVSKTETRCQDSGAKGWLSWAFQASYITLALSHWDFLTVAFHFWIIKNIVNNNNNNLGRRISINTGEAKETSYLFQRISVLVQHFNAVLLHDSLQAADSTDWQSYPPLYCQKRTFKQKRYHRVIDIGVHISVKLAPGDFRKAA